MSTRSRFVCQDPTMPHGGAQVRHKLLLDELLQIHKESNVDVHSTHHIVTNALKYLNDGRLCSWSRDRASTLVLVDVARSYEIKKHAVNARGLERCGDGRSMQTP